jgi:putative tricarboxylic transport membrane protein
MNIADKKRWGEMAVCVGLIIISLAFFILDDFKQTVNPLDPGPALFPALISILLLLMSVGQLVITFCKKSETKAKAETEQEETKTAPANRMVYVYVLGGLVLSGLYIFLFEKVNYLLTTGVYLLSLMLLLGIRKWYVLALVSVLYALISYYLYAVVLKVPLP